MFNTFTHVGLIIDITQLYLDLIIIMELKMGTYLILK